jgi:hypothetical protein
MKKQRVSNLMYRIQRKDGSFRGSGVSGGLEGEQQKVKTWSQASHVKSHLKLASNYSDSLEEMVEKAGAVGDEVVEYELVERRRIPVKEFLSE